MITTTMMIKAAPCLLLFSSLSISANAFAPPAVQLHSTCTRSSNTAAAATTTWRQQQQQDSPVVRMEMTTSNSDSDNSSSARRSFLVGGIASVSTTALVGVLPYTALAEPRPTYLTEPTDEFKENEKKAMEFRRQQLAIKQKFTAVLERLQTQSSTEEQLVQDLQELRSLTIETGGLPLGIKKEDLFKQIRTKKSKGYWPTNVEIAYQSLKSEINFQQSPNTEKDMGNPL